MIEIKILITDEQTLEEYKNISPDLIIDDFVCNTSAWINIVGTEITVRHLTNKST